jgi:hypothetical protein
LFALSIWGGSNIFLVASFGGIAIGNVLLRHLRSWLGLFFNLWQFVQEVKRPFGLLSDFVTLN